MDSPEDSVETKAGSDRPDSTSRPGEGSALSRKTLEKVRSRDPQALALLFEFYFERVFGLAFRLMGDRQAAEDVTQDVFYKVHRAAHQLDPGRDPGPWLTTITYNVCRDYWRSRGHKLEKRSASVDEHAALLAVLSAPGDNPEQALLKSERDRVVQQAIMKLSEPLRTVVLLHDYRGLGHEEIASITGASYDAVRKRYSRALARLGELLKDMPA